MKNPKQVLWALAILFVVLTVCGWLTDGFGFLKQETTNFVQEQQPSAKSLGELLGKQYSQLRDYSVSLDDLSCKIQINEQAYKDLKETFGEDETTWPDRQQAEAQNLRWEHTALLQRYSNVAAKYNDLATDIRTLVDDAGLTIKDIPKAEELAPVPGMCGDFGLPETPAPGE